MSDVTVRGVRYNVEILGQGSPIVVLHGFTGSIESWSKLTPVLRGSARVIAIDLLGHGLSESPPDASRYAISETIADLLAVFDRLELTQVDLLGYSMGGRVALSLAVAAPQRINRLILESVSPGIEASAERLERIRADGELALLLDRAGIEAFIDRWEQVPLFATQRGLAPDIRAALRRQRLRGSVLGLANSLRGAGTGVMAPLHGSLHQVTCRTLLIVGELDRKYRTIGEQLVSALPDAELVVVPGVGHAIHLESPDAFGQIVSKFRALKSTAGSREQADLSTALRTTK